MLKAILLYSQSRSVLKWIGILLGVTSVVAGAIVSLRKKTTPSAAAALVVAPPPKGSVPLLGTTAESWGDWVVRVSMTSTVPTLTYLATTILSRGFRPGGQRRLVPVSSSDSNLWLSAAGT
jgi:hypothetical protein